MFKEMMKNCSAVLMVVVLAVTLSMLACSAFAADLKWSDDWDIHNITGAVMKDGDANNQLTTGAFYGTIAEVKNDAGKTLLGFGGMTGNLAADSEGHLTGVIGITAITAFDHMFQASIVGDINHFKVSDPESYKLYLSADPLKAGAYLFGKGSALVGLIAP